MPGAIVLLKDTKTLQVRSYIAQQDGKYHFYGLSTDVNYQLRAEHNGTTSKIKTVSVFDSHRNVHLDLKLIKKMKLTYCGPGAFAWLFPGLSHPLFI